MMKNRKPRKDGRYSINVSFTATETSLIAWADRQGNFSSYVKRLIKEDMDKHGASSNALQSVILNLLGEEGLKNIFQNSTNISELAVEKEEPPKVNKSKIKNIMKKKEKKEE